MFVADVLTEKSYGMDISGIVVNAAHDNIEKNNLGTRLSVFQGDITKLNSINIKPEALTALYILHELKKPEDEIRLIQWGSV